MKETFVASLWTSGRTIMGHSLIQTDFIITLAYFCFIITIIIQYANS